MDPKIYKTTLNSFKDFVSTAYKPSEANTNLDEEGKRFEHETKKAREETRRKLTSHVKWLTYIWLGFVVLVILAQMGAKFWWDTTLLSHYVLITLIGTTTFTVLFLFRVILKAYFNFKEC